MSQPNEGTPLRRSDNDSIVEGTLPANDDAERRESGRRTMMKEQRQRENLTAPSIEDNETIRHCLEIYNGNKLDRNSAWTLSMIDTLSSLLDRHHKSLRNFQLAGASLEMSSKVYSLRVDSNYLDAVRLASGINARRLKERQLNATSTEDNGEDAGADVGAAVPAVNPKKCIRKAVSSITKNKALLNAPLETVPVQDAIFGKLNSKVGSINAPDRLMNKILPTCDSELRLRSNQKFWDASDVPEDITDYTIVKRDENFVAEQTVAADWILKLQSCAQQLVLRPNLTGYNITNDPINTAEPPRGTKVDDIVGSEQHEFFDNPTELPFAFDISAECNPVPELNILSATINLYDSDVDELSKEEQQILQQCNGLRKNVQMIDDLRPINSSTLEYSYRPMDTISQFWAGPSYWKFKTPRVRTTLTQVQAAKGSKDAAPKKGARRPLAKRRSKLIGFNIPPDEGLFLPLDANAKLRKVNYQKKWDPRKLMLPTKFNFETDFFFKYELAPCIKVGHTFGVPEVDEDKDLDDCKNYANATDDVELFDKAQFTADGTLPIENGQDYMTAGNQFEQSTLNPCNDTVLEIPSLFEGAPERVTQVVVPFAKRAKKIDMKQMKKTGLEIIQNEFKNPEEQMPVHPHPQYKDEKYVPGVASFLKLFAELPSKLPPKTDESLSPALAFYAALHLANDNNFRLFPKEDLKDFLIRQVMD